MPATHATHDVTNQPPPLAGYDVYAADAAPREAVAREGAGWADDELSRLGCLAGDPAWIERALQAALLVRHAPAAVADAFCASRLAGGGWAFGTLGESVPTATAAEIVRRHSPDH